MSRRVQGFGWVLAALLTVALVRPAHAVDTVVYYHTDALHSVTVVTNAQGQVIERTHYAPYGAVLNRSLRDGPGYAGHQEDAATGLVYMQQRYYDPEIGRFLSADPVGVDPASGGNFNRYWYANDNPYRFTDPDGRQIWTDRHGELPGLGCLAYGVGCSHSLATGQQPKAKQSSRPAGQCNLDECIQYRQMNRQAMHDKFQAVVQAGKFGGEKLGEFVLWAAVGHGIGRIAGKLKGLGRFLGFARRDISIGTKIEGQMVRRGWTRSMIGDAINNPARTVATRDTRFMSGGGRMNDAATAYYSEQGGYVVRNNRTGDIVQVSDRNDVGWVAPWDH